MFIRVLSRIPALAIALLFFCWAPAGAVCLQPHPRVCTEFFHSDTVFVGTVISIRNWPPDSELIDGWFYRLRVTKVYRGPSKRIIEVFTENASARFPLEMNHTYLLFASKSGGRLEIDCCGNSAELGEAGIAIREIERVLKDIRAAPGGDIGGRVVLSPFGTDKGIAGISVTARRGTQTYSAVTDKDGWFHIQVLPGVYVVSPESSNWVVTDYDLSYDRSDHVVIQRGGCAELQFLAVAK